MDGHLSMMNMTSGRAVRVAFQGTVLAVFALVMAKSLAQSLIPSPGCLYATHVGDSEQPACEMKDPLDLQQNDHMLRAMKVLGIDRKTVQFRGCLGLLLSVSEMRGGAGPRYVVNYPADIPVVRLIAPLLHELAHVAQMQEAGGATELSSLNNMMSKKIELGADFLAGHLFKVEFKEFELNAFEQNLLVHGLYREMAGREHGDPRQRDLAFRRGVFGRDADLVNATTSQLIRIFRDELYQLVIR
ncbi:hypothetical protein SAMN05518669_11020 [Variovorax sp. YR634]|uniref:hypothetical protein n=1 Tax=Variovorax sp. YR634 TaxID=1884385 RepID=UPI0008945582|nr:hypothetical protein [Variovorax sp. YR634]SDY19115.1 hypothetical protein SAMN05518669_11020 [Variovorax sp. YR634]